MQKKKLVIRLCIVVIAFMTICLSDVIKIKYESVSASSAEKKKVAITFDDGPNPDYTPDLLKGLKERGVSATFFLLGKEVEKYPELVEQMHAEGHLIGTHSYEHVNLCNLTDEKAIEQVDKTNALIEKITGERHNLFVRHMDVGRKIWIIRHP